MPGNFGALDTGFPDLNRYGSTEEKLVAMNDYLVQLLEQLRYTLHNLGVENFNETSLKEITEPIIAEIEDPENGLVARINANAEAIQTEVSKTGTENLDPNDTLYSRITQNAEGIETKVSKNGVISSINQSAESVTINAGKVNLQGYVTATDLSGSGTTVIDGGRIQTGSVSADRISGGTLDAGNIQLFDKFLVKSEYTEGGTHYEYNCGYIGGYAINSLNKGVIVRNVDGRKQLTIDEDRIKLFVGETESYKSIDVTENSITIDAKNPLSRVRFVINPTEAKIYKPNGTVLDLLSL